MGDIARLFAAVMMVFQYEFTLYGFTFSFWQIFCFTVVAGIAAWVLGKLFLDD